MVPPQVNKHYFLDLAPGRSLVEYLVGQGIQFFTIVWRNPRAEHGHWGIEDYIEAQLRAPTSSATSPAATTSTCWAPAPAG